MPLSNVFDVAGSAMNAQQVRMNVTASNLANAGSVSGNIPAVLLAPLVFLVSGFIAFSVGSSWGTFAIMIPIAISSISISCPRWLQLSRYFW